MENCAGPDAVMTIDEDFGIKLNKKCELVPSGCVTSKAFATAESKYKIVKDGVTVAEGKADMCSLAGHADGQVKDYLKLFGAPSSCPVQDVSCGLYIIAKYSFDCLYFHTYILCRTKFAAMNIV